MTDEAPTTAQPLPEAPPSRQMNPAELALLEEVEALGRHALGVLTRLEMLPRAPVPEVVQTDLAAHDPRWTAIGRTHLQQGIAALRRTLQRPAGF